MFVPDFLKANDKIGIASPAGFVSKEKIDNACKRLENDGFVPVVGKNATIRYGTFAGTDLERAADFQNFLDDPEIKAILCSRGGYGSLRTIQKLDFSQFQKKPKWIIGFSDITVFHSFLHEKLNTASLHAAMPNSFFDFPKKDIAYDSLISLLLGNEYRIDIPKHDMNISGLMDAEVIGGNLSILYSLRGTDIDIETDGKIMFVEDLNEQLYHLDRIFQNFKYGGKLDNLAGMLIGSFSEMKDSEPSFAKNAYEIIYRHIEEYDFPVGFGISSGHIKTNLPIILGKEVELKVE